MIDVIEDKIPDITNLAINITLSVKINEVKNKAPYITNLATTAALSVVQYKTPSVSDLVEKADNNPEIKDI